MSFEEETEYTSAHYRCIDPIENFKIKVILKPIKNLYIPLPQFDAEQSSNDVSSSQDESELKVEEYTFKWQEKVFSNSEIKKYSAEPNWKEKLAEKYCISIKNDLKGLKTHSKKIFSYTEADNYLTEAENESDIFTEKTNFVSSLCKKINDLSLTGPSFPHKNFTRKKIINYSPSQDFKNKAHLSLKNIQKMFIMIDLDCKALETNKSDEENHYEAVLCCLSYNHSTSVLQVTPSFSKSEYKPYTVGMESENGKKFYYYWIYHASPSINSKNLTSEIQLMSKTHPTPKRFSIFLHQWILSLGNYNEICCSKKICHHTCCQRGLRLRCYVKKLTENFKVAPRSSKDKIEVFDYQEEVKKLQLDTDFFVGKPDHIYVTLLGEIILAQDFEYDNLHIYYFVKVPPNWMYNDINSLSGRTQSCHKNSSGIFYFSHLFEMNFCVALSSFEDSVATPLELFYEVLSVDNYNRHRNEGYTYTTIPKSPGTYNYSLRCWRISNQTITSQLKRFFIGGGPELEDVSYVGLSTNEKPEIMNRYGLKTIPSGLIEVKLNLLYQSKNFAVKKSESVETEKIISNRTDAGSLLGSVNAVLEAFRRARERMLQAKKELRADLNFTLSDIQGNIKQSD